MRDFIEYLKRICLLEFTSVHPMVSYLAVCRKRTVDWNALGCVGWLLYSWNICIVHSLDEYHAIVHAHGESAKRFLLAVAVHSLRIFISVDDLGGELRAYHR